MPHATIRVPATSANLGPGFDTLGLALGLWNEVRMEPADRWCIVLEGDGPPTQTTQDAHGPRDPAGAAGERSPGVGCLAHTAHTPSNRGLAHAHALPLGEDNLVLRAVRAVERRAGREAPPHRLVCVQRIPISRGLGSSAAAAVAGAVAGALALGERPDPESALAVAAGLEGHPDNAAACALGGLTAAALGPDGAPIARRLCCALSGPVIALVPDLELETRAMREALPEHVPHSDAVWNLQREALLLAAFSAGDLALLGVALQDRLHEPYRAPHVPGIEAVRRAALEAGAAGLCLSGAGPTLLCFPSSVRAASELAPALEGAWSSAGVTARALVLPLARGGVEVRGHHT